MLASKIIEVILDKREIPLLERESFLNPQFESCFENNHLLKGLDQAVERIKKAIELGEKIAIFGDYDADGIPATALLWRALNNLGVVAKTYIPNRSSGYGLNSEAVDDVIKGGINLLITVDNGIVSRKEIALLKSSGVDTIVIDHHLPKSEEFPDQAVAVVDPKQEDCPYPFKELCGCALAFKVMWSLYEKMQADTLYLRWQLDLVAISTVADMVPLIGENRVLASFGLKVLNKTKNKGLLSLIDSVGMILGEIVADDLGYKIGPRLNAPSRMHQDLFDAKNASLQLLISADDLEIRDLVAHLNKQNGGRQGLLEKHFEEALEMLDPSKKCLVVYNPNWSTGIIGLLAGRLMEKYQKPVVALAMEGGMLRGSVRSIEGINAVKMLGGASDFLLQFGGHSKAAGLTLNSIDEIDLFSAALESWIDSNLGTDASPKLEGIDESDYDLDISEVDIALVEALGVLEPYGIGFPRPIFRTKNPLETVTKVGKTGNHYNLGLRDLKGEIRKAIWFSVRLEDSVLEGLVGRDALEVNYQLSVNNWQGRKYPAIQVREVLV